MFKETMEKALNFYEHFDCLIIVNKNGIAEYSTIYCHEKQCHVNDDVTGMHILEIYPDLTEETSSIIRALRTGKGIINEEQIVTHFRGKSFKLLNSDFPIIVDGETVGVIEVSIFLEHYEKDKNKKEGQKSSRLFTLDDIITQDENFMDLKEKIKMVSTTDSSVLIYGETGTGKGMIAQAIHNHSNRYNKPFISQNCAAIPSTLLESTFFGTVKGAYTGAENRPGLFEIANGGTVFLDEINSMDVALQPKILKAIEEKKVMRVGGVEDIRTDVRIISALNVRPEIEIRRNRLREDLFYRLSVVRLDIPPLRERKKDIDLLTGHFIKKYNKEMYKNVHDISELVLEIFYNHDWPGNVRELQNVVESAFNVVRGKMITVQDIPQYLFNRKYDKPVITRAANDTYYIKSLQELVDDFEKKIVIEAIKSSKNLSHAARKLKISSQLLQYKINKYNIRDLINT